MFIISFKTVFRVPRNNESKMKMKIKIEENEYIVLYNID